MRLINIIIIMILWYIPEMPRLSWLPMRTFLQTSRFSCFITASTWTRFSDSGTFLSCFNSMVYISISCTVKFAIKVSAASWINFHLEHETSHLIVTLFSRSMESVQLWRVILGARSLQIDAIPVCITLNRSRKLDIDILIYEKSKVLQWPVLLWAKSPAR